MNRDTWSHQLWLSTTMPFKMSKVSIQAPDFVLAHHLWTLAKLLWFSKHKCGSVTIKKHHTKTFITDGKAWMYAPLPYSNIPSHFGKNCLKEGLLRCFIQDETKCVDGKEILLSRIWDGKCYNILWQMLHWKRGKNSDLCSHCSCWTFSSKILPLIWQHNFFYSTPSYLHSRT